MQPKSNIAAFFDFDDTLIDINSSKIGFKWFDSKTVALIVCHHRFICSLRATRQMCSRFFHTSMVEQDFSAQAVRVLQPGSFWRR